MVSPGPTLSLRNQARAALSWNLALRLLQDALQLAVTVILARLLTPRAYGEVGLVMAIIGFVNAFSFQSFLDHSIQSRREEDANYQGHFAFGGYLQSVLFVLTNLVAFALQALPEYRGVATPLHVASLVLLLSWPSSVRVKMLERALDWRRLRGVQALGLAGSAVMAILLAVSGAGLYALILPVWIKHLVLAYDLFVIADWRPTWIWRAEKYADAFRFGLLRAASGLLLRGRQLLESSLFVPLVGYASLGVYGRATGLTQIVCQVFPTLVLQSVYPILTRLTPGSPPSTRASGLLLRIVSWVVVPLSALLSLSAGVVIHLVYGTQWSEAVPLLPWTLAGGVAAALAYAAYTLLLANQVTGFCLKLDLLGLGGTVLCLLALLPRGVIPYAASLGGLQVLITTIALLRLLRLSYLTAEGLFAALVPSLVSSIAAFGISYSALQFVSAGVPSPLMTSAFAACFVLVYLLCLRLAFSSGLREVLDLLPCNAGITRLFLMSPSLQTPNSAGVESDRAR